MFDVTLSDLLDVLDETADDVESDDGSVAYNRQGNDVASVDFDALAIAASYQYSFLDSIGLSDTAVSDLDKSRTANDTLVLTEQLLIETTFNTDPVNVSDQCLVSMTIGIDLATNSIAVSDAAATGFIYGPFLSDILALTDQESHALTYAIVKSDTLVMTDVPHTWLLPDDTDIEVDFEGDGDLRAVLIKAKPASNIVNAAPPRVVLLPRPPKVLIEHNVVDPTPPNREER